MDRVPQPVPESAAIADQQKPSSPLPHRQQPSPHPPEQHHEKIKLKEINPYLTCDLCKGYLIDATTISECLHSFCRSCIIKFLEDNSFCPVCEVIINKAKPNLKLDKALQDIVYKLVPGLFLSEMLRRKRFYAERPAGEAGRVSPEQRGEDTERTIFNPQDRISLSLEYIGDAATSGLILKDLKSSLEQQKNDPNSKKSTSQTDDAQVESLLKRYLQCPGMCRIDVIKKFIRNKYNVNTDLFQIDILYKRVPLPLPDHYTLIDVAYIYTWKRNEPMRFYFRIIEKGNDELPDLTKVFTPVDAPPLLRPLARSTPNKKIFKTLSTPDRKKRTPKKHHAARSTPTTKTNKKVTCDKITLDREFKNEVKDEKTPAEVNAVKTKDNDCKTKLIDEAKVKKEVYTKITLNRTNNLEIITKIHKVSDKDGINVIDQTVKKKNNTNSDEIKISPSISEEVYSKTVLEEDIPVLQPEVPVTKKETFSISEEAPVLKLETEATCPAVTTGLTDEELELKKFEFLKSIELTSKKTVDNLAKLIQQQKVKTLVNSQEKPNVPVTSTKPCYPLKPPIPNAAMEIVKTKKTITPKPGSNGVKRKNSSPIKSEAKRPKIETKRTTKIIIQQKPGYCAPKLSENAVKQNKSDLHSLFQNCRLNIPSSLSITLKENGETSRKPVQMPPVQNYIEILKIEEKEGRKTITLKRDETKHPTSEVKKSVEVVQKAQEPTLSPSCQNSSNSSTLPPPVESTSKPKEVKEVLTKAQQQQQSFQKIFEESIKKSEVDSTSPEGAADVATPTKRNILEIAQQLYKRTKIEQDNQKNQTKPDSNVSSRCSTPTPSTNTPKLPIPRLNNQRVVKPPKKNQKYETQPNQTLTNLHSSSLGLNYTVSVGKQSKEQVHHTYKVNGVVPPQYDPSLNRETNLKNSPEKDNKHAEESTKAKSSSYNMCGGSFSVRPCPVSPKTLDLKIPSVKQPPLIPKVPQSPRISPAPKSEQSAVQPPKSFSPRNYSVKTPQSSPKQRSNNVSPKLAQSAGSSSVSSTSSHALTPNQLLEKYNIQNLAQLSASINFNAAAVPQNYLNAVQGNQMAALHQAMLLKQFELQNRQKWLNINQGPLLQFEKYLQSLNASNQILGNLKDN